MSLAETCRAMRGIQSTPEDDAARYAAGLGERHEYANGIADRNDAAIMAARTLLAAAGCRASRDRAMPS